MNRITFDQFLQHTAPYERMPVQVSPGLRRGVWSSWLIIPACSLVFYLLPDGDILEQPGFFIWTRGWMSHTWSFVRAHQMVFLAASLTILGLALVLLALTHAYHRAEIGLHAALFIPVLYAAFSFLFALFLLLPVLANLVIWALLVLLGTVTVVLLMAGVTRAGMH